MADTSRIADGLNGQEHTIVSSSSDLYEAKNKLTR